MKNILSKKTALIIAFFIFTYVIYFSFGFHHLSEFITADEHLWLYKRIPQYWHSLADGNFKGTRINDKPGVTTALISGIGMLWENNPENFDSGDYFPPDETRREKMEKMLFKFRLPVLIFNGFFALYFYWIIKKITGNIWISLLSFSLILLSPILLGISQIVNPDSFLQIFLPAAILTFLAFLITKEKKFIFLTGLMLAFSLLSKYSATILYPFFFLLIILYYLFCKKDFEKAIEKKEVLYYLAGYCAIVVISMAIFAVFMPASFVKPDYLLSGTINYPGLMNIMIPVFVTSALMIADSFFFRSRYLNLIMGVARPAKKYFQFLLFAFIALVFLINLADYNFLGDALKLNLMPFDARQDDEFAEKISLAKKILLEFRQLVFSIQPFALIVLLWLWIKGSFKKIPYNFLVLCLSLFIIVYYAGVISKNLLANIRYSISLYPLIMVLGAVGIWDIFNVIKKKFNPAWILLGAIFLSAASLWLTKPFYFNYTNSLLPEKYIITGAWGYGGYEAAEFLNNLPDAQNLTAWSDYGGVCEFFSGSCVSAYKYNPEIHKINYYVITRRGTIVVRQKGAPEKILAGSPVWELDINNRPENFVKIYKAEDLETQLPN